MRIRLLARAAGPDFHGQSGDELDLPLHVAAELVSGGYALALEAQRPAPAVAPAARDPAAEKAVRPKPARKK